MLMQKQTMFGAGLGNCFSTCLAALLDVQTELVPNFCAGANPDWFRDADVWLRQYYKLHLLSVAPAMAVSVEEGVRCIAVGRSPRLENCFHAVIAVARSGPKGEMVFQLEMDPYPDNAGLAGEAVELLFLTWG